MRTRRSVPPSGKLDDARFDDDAAVPQSRVAIAAGEQNSAAVRVDGTGDVTDSHIVWRTPKGAPLTPSVVAVGDEIYAVADSGVATCFDAKTGTVHWQERIDGGHSASPIVDSAKVV